MDIGGFNPHDAQQHLQGVNWPADKLEVVDKAKAEGPPDASSSAPSVDGTRREWRAPLSQSS
jgi:hypothetical protein